MTGVTLEGGRGGSWVSAQHNDTDRESWASPLTKRLAFSLVEPEPDIWFLAAFLFHCWPDSGIQDMPLWLITEP